MGGLSIWHWLIVIAVIAVFFGGRGKISSIMGDVAHGIRSFKEGLKDPVENRAIPDSGKETADLKKTEKSAAES